MIIVISLKRKVKKMNKQELENNYTELLKKYPFGKVEIKQVLKDLDKLEPQKVKVPQFVADYIRYAIENDWDFQDLFKHIEDEEDEELRRWVYHERNQETFATAWINGYDIEEEKKYKITLLNRNDGDLYLVNQNAGVSNKYGHFSPVVLLFTKGTNFSEKCYKLTKKEVVSNGFGWVFDCPGIEIEEVEE